MTWRNDQRPALNGHNEVHAQCRAYRDLARAELSIIGNIGFVIYMPVAPDVKVGNRLLGNLMWGTGAAGAARFIWTAHLQPPREC